MRAVLLAITFATALQSGAAAQIYPSKTITLIVPFERGGAIDVIARAVADGMQGPLSQPIVVENIVGAAGRTVFPRSAFGRCY